MAEYVGLVSEEADVILCKRKVKSILTVHLVREDHSYPSVSAVT